MDTLLKARKLLDATETFLQSTTAPPPECLITRIEAGQPLPSVEVEVGEGVSKKSEELREVLQHVMGGMQWDHVAELGEYIRPRWS